MSVWFSLYSQHLETVSGAIRYKDIERIHCWIVCEQDFLFLPLIGEFYFLFLFHVLCHWPEYLRQCGFWDSLGKNTGIGAISFPRGSSQLRDQTHISYVSCSGRQVLYHAPSGKHHPPHPWPQIYFIYLEKQIVLQSIKISSDSHLLFIAWKIFK